MRGKFPICRKCYEHYCVDGKPPEWLRFLINDLKREMYDDRLQEERVIKLDFWP